MHRLQRLDDPGLFGPWLTDGVCQGGVGLLRIVRADVARGRECLANARSGIKLLSWFSFFVLMAYQLFLGYLMPKPFS